MITNMITTSSTNIFYDNVMKHFTYIKSLFKFTIWELADNDSEKYIQRRIERPAKHAKTMN